MIISETWIGGREAEEDIKNVLSSGHGIGMIARNRRSRGGGIAILYKEGLIKLSEHRFRRENNELVAASGKINGLQRPVFIFALYIKPSLPAHKKKQMLESVVDAVLEIETKHQNPIICIGGDFN